MLSSIWICFDLGVRGDYASLYAWLDEHGAKECAGNGVAFLKFEHEGSVFRAVRSELRRLLLAESTAQRVESASPRVYLIHKDPETQKMKGSWLLGRRKGAPWSGYAPTPSPPDEEDN